MTRKEKIEYEKKRQKELERVEALNQNRKREKTLTGDEEVLAGRQDVGAFDSIKKRTGVKTSGTNNTDTYKSGNEFYSTDDTSGEMSKRDKRIANRQFAKEYRKNTRAEKLGKRKGMSDQQAKDFMQNRRDRFRQMGTNFVKGLTGNAMDTAVDDRLMRRDGSGTLQNMKTEDGKTYDATSPYKGSASKNFSDRGGTRDEVDKYFDVIHPKSKTPPASKTPEEIKIKKNPKPEKVIEEDTENKNKISLTPHSGKYNYHEVDSSDQMPYTATENVTQDKNIYTPEQQRLNEMRKSEFSRKAPLGSSLGMTMFGLPLGAASGMINLAGNLISRKAEKKGSAGEEQKKNIDKFAFRSGG